MRQSSSSPQIVPTQCGVNGSISSPKISSVLINMCPLIVIFLQFSISSMFMWMLCEGIHLNNVLTVSVFKNHFKTYYFHILGWGRKKDCFCISEYLVLCYSSSILYNIELEYCYVC
jgi:hypothetical protein